MDKYWYMSLIEITFKWLFFQVDEGGLDVEVTNLPSGVYEKKIQSRLKKLSENCGGRVVSVCKDVAVLRFKCHNDAAKYVTNYWNIETSYWNIKTSHWNIKKKLLKYVILWWLLWFACKMGWWPRGSGFYWMTGRNIFLAW